MSRLDTAMDMFTRALDQLESALSNVSASDAPPDALREEIKGLRADCARLEEELGHARSEAAALRNTNATVRKRLDGTIAELETYLRG